MAFVIRNDVFLRSQVLFSAMKKDTIYVWKNYSSMEVPYLKDIIFYKLLRS